MMLLICSAEEMEMAVSNVFLNSYIGIFLTANKSGIFLLTPPLFTLFAGDY